MRLAYLVSQYPAASHTFIGREVAALRAAGHDVQTFSVRRPADDELRRDPDRVEFEHTTYLLPVNATRYLGAQWRIAKRHPSRYAATVRRALRHRVPGVRAAVYSFVYFLEAVVLAEQLEARRVERLHNHFANAGAIVGMLAAQLADLPWSLTLHGISETDYPAGNLLAQKIDAADAVACVSEFGRAQAFRLADPRDWPKLSIVRCGIDFEALPAAPPGREHDSVRVVCVARLSAEKGHLGLLDAYASVARDLPPSRLSLVGDGPARSAIGTRVEQLGIEDLVEFSGRLPESDTLEAIADADILVLASFMEGLPVVLMEALALRCAVIAPRVAGIPELVIDGVHGLLFTPGNWEELANHLARLIADPDLREALGSNGPARVAEFCDIRDAAAQLVAIWSASPSAVLGAAMEPR